MNYGIIFIGLFLGSLGSLKVAPSVSNGSVSVLILQTCINYKK